MDSERKWYEIRKKSCEDKADRLKDRVILAIGGRRLRRDLLREKGESVLARWLPCGP